jgi:molybdopterin-binding protein
MNLPNKNFLVVTSDSFPTWQGLRLRRLGRFIHRLRPFYNDHMAISARNKLRGTIEEIQLGDVMAHVVVRVGNNLIESAITRRSADELKLKKGDTVTAVVKATEVMIQKD